MKSWIIAVGLGVAATADAGPLADALAKADAKAIEALRANKDDVAARCTLGAVYAKRNDLPRASLYLAGCTDATLPDDIAPAIAKTAREVTKKLRDSDLSFITIDTAPDPLPAEISAYPGERFQTPATIWVKAGTYEVKAIAADGTKLVQTVTVGEHSRATAELRAPAAPKATAPRTTTVNFEHDAAAENQNSGPPPDPKHKTLVPDKYEKKVPAPGSAIEDPLAIHRTTRAPRTLWLGVRVGGGMFDDGATAARAGGAVAATMRYRVAAPYFVAGRLDWSRRGGETPDALDVLGASAGAGATLTGGSIGVALIAQLRADLRLADERQAMTVKRLGVSAAAGVELTLPDTPISAGVRFEQGVTELVPGARDRAVLVEVGVDWR